eukprot:TRINITY_DN993_c0_g1_i1.p1 TRINITY_DN993_c0_g1~~TRINITY_DN993_c0_g1_i1.p1  ORF type:complete len:184 (+),score=24.96 TRINITY_DN993_c0_g1_i1:62-553(+)
MSFFGDGNSNGNAALDFANVAAPNKSMCPTMSLSQRITGFAIMLVLGVIVSLLSTIFFLQPALFGIFYTLGNVLALFSTAFLYGPMEQLKAMFKPTRIIATIIYIGSLVMTLVVVLVFQPASNIWVLLCIVIQYIAFTWYSISYIPYARTCIKKTLKGSFANE